MIFVLALALAVEVVVILDVDALRQELLRLRRVRNRAMQLDQTAVLNARRQRSRPHPR